LRWHFAKADCDGALPVHSDHAGVIAERTGTRSRWKPTLSGYLELGMFDDAALALE
jgi:hypothetical protein